MGVEQGVNQGDEPLHVLVIDTYTPEAFMLSDILTPDGFEVRVCRDADAATAILRANRTDIVIEGEGVPIKRYPNVGLVIAYQQQIDDMSEAQRGILMARGVLPIGKDPLLLEESVNRYGFLRRIKDSAAPSSVK